ncbi:MAG TPA: dihydrolipoyl dehydrogenase [Spirochaetia bacterium]|nr:dihydrolipoyl dehydrogenase [Spirochaetia bacterium]
MADISKFDLVIIGSGPGGYVAAIRAAQLGMNVAIVERSLPLGGTCLNIGCIPSKALLDSSELFQKTRDELGAHGISTGKVTLDLGTMMKRKAAVVEKLTSGVSSLMKLNKIQVFEGTGSVTATGRVSVKDSTGGTVDLAAGHIILATGSVPVELPFLKYDGKTVVSSTEALAFDKVPETLAIVGAGAIGLELGSVWNRLGSKVTFVELMPSILPGWDTQLSKTLVRELKKQGMEFHLSARVTGFEKQAKGNGILLAEGEKGEKIQVPAEKVLVAVGRRPSSDGLGLEALSIHRDDRSGRIVVNQRYETSVPGIYAIGDLIHGPMLAHKAEDEGIASVELIAGIHGHVNYGVIPGVVYTWPEAATVGRSEESLKAEGIPYRKGSFPFGINGRAIAMDATAGFVKILAHERTDRILGVHIVGPWASDLISEAVIAMEFSASAEDLARTVHAHPTLSEVTREAALAVDGRAIHSK